MDLYAELAALVARGEPFVLATVIESAGSTPQKPGSKMVVLADGSLRGTVGGGAIEYQIIEAARELLASAGQTRILETHLTHELGMCCGGRMKVFLEKQGAPPQLTVFGAGHVAKALAALAVQAGFRVRVVDSRSEWATAERFPGCEVLVEDPADHARGLAGGALDYFCVTTHDHPLDQAVVEALLPKPAAYLGVIGSRRKAERFRMRLQAAGAAPEALDRIRSPMGLPIGALTPEEIAVSIVAELIQVRRGQEPRR
ncbi:xanthine dehydrogenase accessory protein XdhC [Stigmatella sp. ncwal1]|uniref:Xanthine dehydrogenase accessory protein XdhC n=1 Tax=Stigmatella ashevillensis TaxID=2995309 RepID=A0ABT5DHU6_9BACT|nr:xanthine dehydrogenase accessory protein XdhC [Stigmatella ashevillena]MDC0713227.1 xanthine dehydrogenase accessory protein XdhC [Stigmatella ashevillena]